MSYERVKNKLLLFFTVAVCLLIATVYLLNNKTEKYIESHKYIAEFINIAGRQRMLSQNIAKNTLAMVYSGQTFASLDSLTDLLENSHYYLETRKNILGIPNEQKKKFDSLFQEIEPYLKNIVADSKLIQTEPDSSRKAIQQLMNSNEAHFLPLMDQITNEYESLAKVKLDEINTHSTFSNILIAIAIITAASLVFIITDKVVKAYSIQLNNIQKQLHVSINDSRTKVEKLEFLTHAIKVGIWEFTRNENSESWSDELYHILGYEPGEIQGNFNAFLERVHPEDQQKLIDASEASRRTGLPSTIEIRVLSKKQGYKWVEATGNVKRTETGYVSMMIGGVIDIHGRKVLENQLKVFVENAPAAIAMLNKEMEYTAVSNRWISDYGLEGKVLIGRNHYELFPEIEEEWKSIHKRCLTGKIEKRDADAFIRSNGETQWLKWEVRPWYISDKEIGGIIMFTEDITEEINRSVELEQAKIDAELASKAKEEFLATMSHEIRTPLNAVSGLSQILISDSPKPEQIDNLNLLKFSADNLLNLINDILDIGKIESGKLYLENKPFDLKYLLHNVKRSLDFKAKENKVKIFMDYDTDLSAVFVGDAVRITQIVYNLTGNAIKFTRKGSVWISAKKISETDKHCKLSISVKDDGIGISAENQEKIFDSFIQADTGTTRQYGGTGLGLFITKKLLQMMDSEIKLESKLGEGSEFHFTIELEKSTETIDKNSALKNKTLSKEAKKLRILVAEDNAANQIIIKTILNKAGIRHEVVNNGKEVTEKVSTKAYDLILMDLQMPIMGGYEATRIIRNQMDPYFKQVPIIALTADAFSDVKEKTLAIGMDGHLTKPYNIFDLYRLIEKYSKINNPNEPEMQ